MKERSRCPSAERREEQSRDRVLFNSQKVGVRSGELAAFLSGSESPSKHSLQLCRDLCL